jgi:hypothetical protein
MVWRITQIRLEHGIQGRGREETALLGVQRVVEDPATLSGGWPGGLLLMKDNGGVTGSLKALSAPGEWVPGTKYPSDRCVQVMALGKPLRHLETMGRLVAELAGLHQTGQE